MAARRRRGSLPSGEARRLSMNRRHSAFGRMSSIRREMVARRAGRQRLLDGAFFESVNDVAFIESGIEFLKLRTACANQRPPLTCFVPPTPISHMVHRFISLVLLAPLACSVFASGANAQCPYSGI